MQDAERFPAAVLVQTAITIAVLLLGALVVLDGGRVRAAVIGGAGLLFVAAALAGIDRWPATSRSAGRVPLRLLECGVWAVAAALVVRLLGLAGG